MARSAGTVGVASYGAPTYNIPPAHSFNQSMPQSMPQQIPQAIQQAPAMLGQYAPPPSLTAGLPDPASVERQKSGYMRTLEDQEKQNKNALEDQRKQRVEYVHAQAEQMRKQLMMQIEQQVKQQEMALTQQYNEQLLQLNQQYHTQKAALEHQALQLTMQYQQKAMEDEMMKKQMELQKEQYEAQHKFQIDMQKLASEANKPPPGGMLMGAVMPQGTGNSYVPPPMTAQGTAPSYTPPPATAGSVSLAAAGNNGSFQLPPGGAMVQPYGSGYVSMPARTVIPGAMPFSPRADQQAYGGYISAPAVVNGQPASGPTGSFSARGEPIATNAYPAPATTYA